MIIGPPPINEAARLAYQVTTYGSKATGIIDRTTENARLYAAVCDEVGKEMGIPVVNLCELMTKVDGWTKFLNSDGLHLSEAGQKFVLEKVIENIPKGARSEDIPVDFPFGRDIDGHPPLQTIVDHVAQNPWK